MTATVVWATNWSHGILNVSGGSLPFALVGTGMSINSDPAYVRTGSYSLKAVGTGGETSAQYASLPGSPTIFAGRFYLMWHVLPNIPVTICRVYVPTGSTMRVCFDPADQKVYVRYTSNGVKADLVLAQDIFYRIDFKGDVSANPSTADVQVNGIAGGQITYAQAATYFTSPLFGLIEISPTISAGEIYIADAVFSVTPSDYPIGAGKVIGLSPDVDGTHNGGTNIIEDQAGVNINGGYTTAHDLVNSVPIGDATAYIKQIATGTGNYAEIGFADTTETDIQGVMACLAYKSAATQANNGQARIRDGAGQETTIYSGDMSESSNFYKSKLVTIPVAGWSQSAVNGLLARIGYSSDANPVPYWLDLMIEVAVAQPTGTTYDESISLGRSAGMTPTENLSAAEGLNLGRSSGITQEVNATAETCLSLDKGLGLQAAGGLVAEDAITLAKSLGLSTSGGLIIEETLSLARAAGLSTIVGAIGEAAISLTRTAGLSPSSLVTAEANLSLLKTLGITASPQQISTVAIQLAKNLSISAAGGINIFEQIALTKQLGMSWLDGIGINESLTLGRSAGISASESRTVNENVNLAKSMALQVQNQLTAAEAILMQKGLGITTNNVAVIVEQVGLGKVLMIQASNITEVYEAITLALALAIIAGVGAAVIIGQAEASDSNRYTGTMANSQHMTAAAKDEEFQ